MFPNKRFYFFLAFISALVMLGLAAGPALAQSSDLTKSIPQKDTPPSPPAGPSAPVPIEAAGGPDPFGYVFIDSNEAGGPAYSFENISSTGTLLTLADDQVSGAIPIGFSFTYYGTSYSNLYVSSNGFLTLLSGQVSGCCFGQTFPSTNNPNGVIAGWWADLYPHGGGTVRYQTLGSAPDRRFIVQFTNVQHFHGGNPVTFQFKLFETTDNIEVHYTAALTDGDQHSAGIENQTGTVGLQYYVGTNILTTPLAVRYYYNHPPVLGAIGNQIVDEQSSLSFVATASDLDAPLQTLSFSLDAGAPVGASIDPATGAFTWTPTEAQGPGVYPVTVRVTDNGTPSLDDYETIQVTVNEVNSAPVLDPIGDQTVDELTLLSFTASGIDADLPANTLTYSLDLGAPEGASIDPATGVFSWTPTEAQGPGSYDVTVTVSDGTATDAETITITVYEVNTAPVLDPIGNQTIDEGVELTFTAAATDSDLPANTLAYSLDPSAPAGASIDPATGAFTWTPTEAQGPGIYPITVRVTDDGTPSLDDYETIQVTVNEVNSAPVLGAIGDKTVDEGVELTFTATATDADLPATTLTYSLDPGAPVGASIDPATGAFSWTPTEAQGPGSYDVTVTVSDGTATDTETITITVYEVNIAPVLDPIGNQTVDEGVELTFTAAASDADLPANSLAYSLDAGAPEGASIDPTTGVFSWTPTEAQGPGVYPVTVRVTDDGTPSLDDYETIQVTVDEVNSAPVLGAIGDKTVDELTLLSFTAIGIDSDLPANTLTYSLDLGAPEGASIDPATGAFTWTPTEAQGPGVYPVTVRVTDNGIPAMDDYETIQVTVNEINAAPTVQAGNDQTVGEGEVVAFTGSFNNPDQRLRPLEGETYHWDFGDGSTADDTLTPTHAYADDGVYTVTLSVSDILGAVGQDTLLVTVNNVAPALSALPNLVVKTGQTRTVTGTFTDPGWLDTHTVVIEWMPGVTESLDLAAGVSGFEFEHTFAAAGQYNVTVTVTDDDGGTSSTTFVVRVSNYLQYFPIMFH